MNDFPLCQCVVCANDDEQSTPEFPVLISSRRATSSMLKAMLEADAGRSIVFVSPIDTPPAFRDLASWPYLYKT